MKRYEAKVLEILDDGSAIIELPDKLCKKLGWNLGDDLSLTMKDGQIILKKINGIKSTNKIPEQNQMLDT